MAIKNSLLGFRLYHYYINRTKNDKQNRVLKLIAQNQIFPPMGIRSETYRQKIVKI